MQTKGKKKIIDNAGALQKKYTWKSEKQKKKPPVLVHKRFLGVSRQLCLRSSQL